MKKIGIIYSFNANATKKTALKLQAHLGETNVEMVNADHLTEEEFLKYKNYILGVPTWFDGELPTYWDEFTHAMEEMDLKGRKFAIFGLGDQKGYPENFGDAVGIMARILEEQQGEVVGYTSIGSYSFERSKAVKEKQFVGLVLDEVTQADLSEQRIKSWVDQLKTVFN